MRKGYKFSIALTFFSLAVTSVGGLATCADGSARLDKRTAANLVTQVDRPNTFYRAITGVEKEHLATSYPEHGHPKIWKPTAGDFSAQGAFYAFHVSGWIDSWLCICMYSGTDVDFLCWAL